jgi:alcohol dehydrogenase
LSGGLAEYCLLREGTDLFRLPDGLSDTVASPANCATATIAAALRTAGDIAGRSVLVQGAGMMGLTACAMARAAGAETVLCCDIRAERLARAVKFGATHAVLIRDEDGLQQAVLEATDGSGVDVAIEASGARAAFSAGLNALREHGTYLLIGTGFPGAPPARDLETIVERHLLLHGVHDYTPPDLAAALQFLSEHGSRFPFASLVAQSFPLADAESAFATARQYALLRVAISP